LKTANGDYVKLSGDPHIVVSIGGKIQKFDIGFGSGGFALPDGTKVTWDTNAKHILNNFQINGVKVSTFDNVDVHNVDTGSAESNLSAIASQLQQLQGKWNTPLGTPVGTKAPAPKSAKPAVAAKPVHKPAPAAKAALVVKKGDTLSAIARANNTTVAALVSANGIKNANVIHTGQKLVLPAKRK